MKKSGTLKRRGTIKEILKDHFHGFWQLHAEQFPESVRSSIERGDGNKGDQMWDEGPKSRWNESLTCRIDIPCSRCPRRYEGCSLRTGAS